MIEHAHAAVGELRKHLEPELDAVERAADVEPPDGDVPGPEQAGGHRRIDEVGRIPRSCQAAASATFVSCGQPITPTRAIEEIVPCGAGRQHPRTRPFACGE